VPVWKTKAGKALIATILILIVAVVGGSVGAAAAARARCRRDTSVAPACQPSATSSSAPTSPSTFVIPSDLRVQSRWGWCNKCEALAYSGFVDQGPCPAGGVHSHASSGDYPIFANGAVVPVGYQNNWRWCSKCQALAFAGNTTGSCSAGGVHDHSASADYMIEVRGDALPAGRQDDWRWCNKCQVLSYAGFTGNLGPCSAGGLHDHTGSRNYVLFTGIVG
jgi:hypothetical protein